MQMPTMIGELQRPSKRKKVERRVTLRTCLPFGTCEVKKSDSNEFLMCTNSAQYNKTDFCIFSEGELTFMFAICCRPFRLFVCRLSRLCLCVTFVHPAQPVEIFGNVSSRLVPWPSVDIHGKFYKDRPREPL